MCASTRTSVCARARLHVEGDAAEAEAGGEERVEAQVGAHVEHHVGRRVGRVARDLREQDLAEEVRDGACGARGAAAAAEADARLSAQEKISSPRKSLNDFGSF